MALAAALLLQACASPGQAILQPLRVETPGCPNAQCSLSNDRGTWELAATPGVVTVLSSHSPLRVACRGPEGIQGQAGASSSLSTAGHGGTVAGGVIGTGVGVAAAAPAMAFVPPLGAIIVVFGAAVGAASGQAVDSHQRTIVYPDLITVPMNCAPALAVAAAAGPARAPLGFGVRGLTLAQRQGTGAGESAAVQVTDVVPGSAADRAGLRPGDLLLTARGQPLADAAALQALVQALAAGEALGLRLWRAGALLDVTLVQPAVAP